MKPVDHLTAAALIDFSGGDDSLKGLADVQLKGAVALHNMIADKNVGFAYLADEVGMGKTYIALGVVSILRYFNPTLRVLYICPSKNVQEKWDREYKSFIRTNIKVNQHRIRTQDGYPAAPYVSCRNVDELIYHSASGYYADFFIGKDSFSIGLTDDDCKWNEKRDKLKKLVPAHDWKGIIKSKSHVKEQYAKALNYILPTFDLIIIDEAHNFKHGFDSSDRNKVLSRVLGINGEDDYVPRVKNALLLSATPYDRNLQQLRNQLNLVGKKHLLPDDIENSDQTLIIESLQKFMVRRLNTLKINDKEHTRNMYRREWRSGPKAEIFLESDEQKLVTALVQKKVGEVINKKGDNPSFQMGMLASFESFMETTKSEPTEFDGEKSDLTDTDAQDRKIISTLVESYVDNDLGRTLPHPKMDSVVSQLSQTVFNKGRKQIIFVRRVKSVRELKNKFDEAYNEWLYEYMMTILQGHHEQSVMLGYLYSAYRKESRYKDNDITGGDVSTIDVMESIPPKNDTFFSWFFRGEPSESVFKLLKSHGASYTTPELVRISLSAKNQLNSLIFEINWARYICDNENIDLASLLEKEKEIIAVKTSHYINESKSIDHENMFRACQLGFIDFAIDNLGMDYLYELKGKLLELLPYTDSPPHIISSDRLTDYLTFWTFFDEIDKAKITKYLFPHLPLSYAKIKENKFSNKTYQLLQIHRHLISQVLRTGHGIVDVYLSRIKLGVENLSSHTRKKWVESIVKTLLENKESSHFTSWKELIDISDNLELIIKTNLPDIYEKQIDEYTKYLSQSISLLSPTIGATGEVSERSSIARKFRMPGYPLILISTDVFQEGEDLHTFCDSVVHYGISGSPVSIEQKTGRVDRVNSLAQRRLLSIQNQPIDNDDYIQVSFPYIKESIEFIQVRQLAYNLNHFIESLHEINTNNNDNFDFVETEKAMMDNSEIPSQILRYLKSPYDPVIDESVLNNYEKEVLEGEVKAKRILEHVVVLLENEISNHIDKYIISSSRNPEISEHKTHIHIKSARSSGEMLISLTKKIKPFEVECSNIKQVLHLMNAVSWRTFHRTYAIETIKNTYQLYANTEMLVGDESITSSSDIDMLFERMEISHNPDVYTPLTDIDVSDFIHSCDENIILPYDRFGNVRVSLNRDNDLIKLTFIFGVGEQQRQHRIYLYQTDNRCVFISPATDEQFIKKLDAHKLLEYTWIRNRNIDLVEFVVNPEGAIVGRVVHPLTHMKREEFMYCAYTLAVEVDRLEYIINQTDRF